MAILATLALTGCYEAFEEIITEDEASRISLVKDYKFYGYGLDENGEWETSEPDVYEIVNKLGKNVYVAQTDDPETGEREMRFMELEPNWYLLQMRTIGSPRHQLMLLRKERQTYYVVVPHRFNDQDIDVWGSQQAFAQQLDMKLGGSGYGPYQLYGDPFNIQRFMHSLKTLPTRDIYKFQLEE